MLTVTPYKSKSELARAHPEIPALKVVYIAQRGQCVEAQIAALHRKNIDGTVYQVGRLFYQRAESLPPTCACFQYIGDNPDCPRHFKASQP